MPTIPIYFVSGAVTYYPVVGNVDFQFVFSRPPDFASENADYFSIGGTIAAPSPQYRSEFFVITSDSAPPYDFYVDYTPSTPFSVPSETLQMPDIPSTGPNCYIVDGNSLSFSVQFQNLGISAPIFQLAGDISSYPGQFDSFGVDYPIFSTVNTPHVHLPEPSATVTMLILLASLTIAAIIFRFQQFSRKFFTLPR